jgi:hypothetical protein
MAEGTGFTAPWVAALQRNRLVCGAIFVSLFLMAFWTYRHTEGSAVVRRAFSAGNRNDFSWRNRLVAYEGAMQMMASRPWTGFGWDRPTDVFAEFFMPRRLTEPLAIQLNDYFTVGMTLGLPGLACFLGYLVLSVRARPRTQGFSEPLSPKDLWRAGTVVLLIGLWLERGLFWLALTVPFWILLELGRDDLAIDSTGVQLSLRGATKLQTSPLDAAASESRSAPWGKVVRAKPFSSVLAAVCLCFVTAMLWANARDPFQRLEFSLLNHRGQRVKGVVVRPRPLRAYPVVVYLPGLGNSLDEAGDDLRRIAEMNMAAVGLEYDPVDYANFDQALTLVLDHLHKQRWANADAVAWVAFSEVAQRSLSFLLRHSEHQPELMVLLGDGWVQELGTSWTAGWEAATNTPVKAKPIRAVPMSSELSPEYERTLISPSLLTKLRCPILLVHGENGGTFPAAETMQFADLMRKSGISVDLRVLRNGTNSLSSQPDAPALTRALAEYCGGFFGSLKPLRINGRPSYWYYWLPVGLIALSLGLRRFLHYVRAVRATYQARKRLDRALSALAVLLTAIALTQAAVQVGLPQLRASGAALELTRQWLVRPRLWGELDWLIRQPGWRDHRIAALLDNLELADLQRKSFYAHLEEDLYRGFVLSTDIAGDMAADPGWRRQLWENFYPRVRKERDPFAAAQLVIRFLRERVSLAPVQPGPAGPKSAWEQGLTDFAGFETIYTAALRSIGVAARLNAAGMAEFWTGANWAPAPRPVISSLLPVSFSNRHLQP